ncbi:MAG: hypothetical protein RJA11_1095 [Bacteroidota bacterium]
MFSRAGFYLYGNVESPLGSARGATSAPLGVQPNIVRRAKPRREMYCKPLPLGSARGAIVYALGVQPCIRSGCNRVCARGAIVYAPGVQESSVGVASQ